MTTSFVSISDNSIGVRQVVGEMLRLLGIKSVDNIQMWGPNYWPNTTFSQIDKCDMYVGVILKEQKHSEEEKIQKRKIAKESAYCHGIGKPYVLLLEDGVVFDGYHFPPSNAVHFTPTFDFSCAVGNDAISTLRFLKAYSEEHIKRCIEQHQPVIYNETLRDNVVSPTHHRLEVDVTHQILDKDKMILKVRYLIQSLIDNLDFLLYQNELSELTGNVAGHKPKYYFELMDKPFAQLIAPDSDEARFAPIDESNFINSPFKLQIPIKFDPIMKGEVVTIELTLRLRNYRPFKYDDLQSYLLPIFPQMGSGCIATWQIIQPTLRLSIAFEFPVDYGIERESYLVFSGRDFLPQHKVADITNPVHDDFGCKKRGNKTRLSLTVKNPQMYHQYLLFYSPIHPNSTRRST
jgi:hypothetical protein